MCSTCLIQPKNFHTFAAFVIFHWQTIFRKLYALCWNVTNFQIWCRSGYELLCENCTSFFLESIITAIKIKLHVTWVLPSQSWHYFSTKSPTLSTQIFYFHLKRSMRSRENLCWNAGLHHARFFISLSSSKRRHRSASFGLPQRCKMEGDKSGL